MISNRRLGVLSCAVALALGCGAPVIAGGPIGGSTEITQLMNNVQLMNSYAKQVKGVLTQVQQYKATLLALRQLSPARLAAMGLDSAGISVGSDVIDSIQTLNELNTTISDLDRSMDVLSYEGGIAIDTIERMRSRGISIGPNDYAELFGELSRERSDVYGARYERLNQAVINSQSDIERMNAIAATAPEIATNVEGFGALVQSNAVMVGQLGGLRQTLAQNGIAANAAAKSADAQEARQKASKLMLQQWTNGWSN